MPFYEASTVVEIVASAFGIKLLGEPNAAGESRALRAREQVKALGDAERYLGRFKAAVLAEERRNRASGVAVEVHLSEEALARAISVDVALQLDAMADKLSAKANQIATSTDLSDSASAMARRGAEASVVGMQGAQLRDAAALVRRLKAGAMASTKDSGSHKADCVGDDKGRDPSCDACVASAG